MADRNTLPSKSNMNKDISPQLVAPLVSALALDAGHITAPDGLFPDLSLRLLRELDREKQIPEGFFIGGHGRKLWRVADLVRWSEWGFPSRAEFKERLADEEGSR